MSKTIYFEYGISVEDDGDILLIRCPKCYHENYAFAVADGVCCWCGYDAHEDKELKKRMENYLSNNKKQ